MDDLKRIQPDGDTRGIAAREQRREPDERNPSEENRERPMKADGPAERLLVDDEDENQREKNSQTEARDIGKQAQQARFGKDHFAKLTAGCSEVAEQTEFAAPVYDQRQQSARDSH